MRTLDRKYQLSTGAVCSEKLTIPECRVKTRTCVPASARGHAIPEQRTAAPGGTGCTSAVHYDTTRPRSRWWDPQRWGGVAERCINSLFH